MDKDIRPLTRRDLERANRQHLVEYLQAHGTLLDGTESTDYLRVLAVGLFDMDEVSA